jgi:TonB family protein
MKKGIKRGWHARKLLVVAASFLFVGVGMWVFFSRPAIRPWWKTLTQESRKILGGGREEIPPEESRIREELIFKKMQEASIHRDWKGVAPEYPRPKKAGSLEGKEQMQTFKESSDFKEMDREVKDYLEKKQDRLFYWEPPPPPLKNPTDYRRLKDKGAEEAIARLLSTKEKAPAEKPLEENVELGIKGSLASRRILERPNPPQVKVRVEAEIELTVWVLPSGTVDRVIPSVKGDADLERVAIQYLKQWRFAPLPQDESQVEQWGSIPIKFKLQ